MPTHFFWTADIKWGKGTADHMPLGDWLTFILQPREEFQKHSILAFAFLRVSHSEKATKLR